MTSIGRAMLLRYASTGAAVVLENRLFDQTNGQRTRWIRADRISFVRRLRVELEGIFTVSNLDNLPTGARLMVEFAALTIAAYRTLVEMGVTPDDARRATSDMAWYLYRQQLSAVSFPFRITSRNPAVRLKRTLRMLLLFPFGSTGAPGYDVKSWTDAEGNTYTHFQHCPPQSFVRALIAAQGDNGELQAFAESWCSFDWPGADVIAGDGVRGHYARAHTLSNGDSVCDMCWRAEGC